MAYFKSPYPPCDPQDKAGVRNASFETVVRRWPVIITGVIDHLYNSCHELSLQVQAEEVQDEDVKNAKLEQGKQIIEKLSKLKYQMGRDHALENIPQDGGSLIDTYNDNIAKLAAENKNTWFTAPWLFAECYLYRLIRSYFALASHWNDHDPFAVQKIQTFKHSAASIYKIASIMHELSTRAESSMMTTAQLKVVFYQMIQMSLWGNATDLSLLTHLSESDIQRLQTVGEEAQTERKKFILKDDQDAVWEHLVTLTDARVDFVLDNAGFELFTDLVFADFLVTHTPHISKVVFHPKLIPWFVSDVTPQDFKEIIPFLLDPEFFLSQPEDDRSPGSVRHLRELAVRWQQYIDQGVFSLSVPLDTPLGASHPFADFWTTQWPYWDMKLRSPEVHNALTGTGLVIFKVRPMIHNFVRWLTGDVKWPAWTPFAEAIGPLAGSFPLLSLRTNKADVVVGVQKEVAEGLDASEEKWRVNGRCVERHRRRR
ncbi:DUF89-domain-containing protein [Pluteus cervinus]|uniref:DUF89-domain-containing protein n=1 Tax=Pluteus cervinus TaxID=181527 RepID=A0ACD3AVZ2_9AGAR|nr:DUF89-domain-containing protein [Pluteus cervinus]